MASKSLDSSSLLLLSLLFLDNHISQATGMISGQILPAKIFCTYQSSKESMDPFWVTFIKVISVFVLVANNTT